MSADESEHYQRELAEKKREGNYSDLNHTLDRNMREQPQATKHVYSPRRPGKTVENADENSKSYIIKSMKLRKSLQILQPSADGQNLLVGGSARKIKNEKHSKRNKEISRSKSKQSKLQLPKRSDDGSPSASSEVESASSDNPSDVQTISNEAYSLMVQEPAPEKYWELVAEERRKALEETLQENMKLYQIIEQLKAENAALCEKANHADYYATMYKIAQDNDQKPEETKNI